MTSFKSGSGNLDFGENESNEEEKETSREATEHEEPSYPDSGEQSTSKPPQQSPSQTDRSPDQSNPTEKYPYFVRRSNVGDERDNRLEIHVRDKVIDREAGFRRELAEQLGVGEISKTDIREFALLDAYHNPERIAERMREEVWGARVNYLTPLLGRFAPCVGP